MRLLLKHKLLIAAVTILALGSGGIAYAATQSSSNPRQAFLNDVAKRLNVSRSQLNSALKAALVDRLNAEVKAGVITQAQANRIEQRLDRRGAALFFGPGGRLFGLRGRLGMFGPASLMSRPLGAAASYLGVTDAQLLKDLGSGKSLAQVATASGKSVSGLEQTIISAEKTKLDQRVAKGTITKAQEQRMLSNLSARVDALVNRTGFPRLRAWGASSQTWRGPAPQNAPMIGVPNAPAPGPGAPPPGPTA